MTRVTPFPNASRCMVVVWGLVAVNCLPELVLQLADLGLFGQPLWRTLAYQNGAFWPGLLENWRPNFPAQPVTMFLTYSWLHVGLSHLAGNVLGLVILAHLIAPGTLGGAGRLALVYMGSALGAALAFALLYSGSGSMVGASGAVFGLAGAAIVWHWRPRRHTEPRRAALEALGLGAGLVVLILVTGPLYGGPVAWEAHVGGAATGALLGALLRTPARDFSNIGPDGADHGS